MDNSAAVCELEPDLDAEQGDCGDELAAVHAVHGPHDSDDLGGPADETECADVSGHERPGTGTFNGGSDGDRFSALDDMPDIFKSMQQKVLN